MSELLLSILRISFLVALWWFVLTVVSVLRRDLQAPRDAKPLTPARSTNKPSQRPTLRSRKTSTKLVIVEGALTGTVLPLGTSPILIGRAPFHHCVRGRFRKYATCPINSKWKSLDR